MWGMGLRKLIAGNRGSTAITAEWREGSMLVYIPAAATDEYPLPLHCWPRTFRHQRQQYGWDAAD